MTLTDQYGGVLDSLSSQGTFGSRTSYLGEHGYTCSVNWSINILDCGFSDLLIDPLN